jgi:hypothetical protein
VLVAELLVEVGGPRRFTIGGFARFNASAPLAASTAEGPGEPVRHRYNPGGNRRVNRALHMMAVTQLRCEPRAKALYENARSPSRPATRRYATPRTIQDGASSTGTGDHGISRFSRLEPSHACTGSPTARGPAGHSR